MRQTVSAVRRPLALAGLALAAAIGAIVVSRVTRSRGTK